LRSEYLRRSEAELLAELKCFGRHQGALKDYSHGQNMRGSREAASESKKESTTSVAGRVYEMLHGPGGSIASEIADKLLDQ